MHFVRIVQVDIGHYPQRRGHVRHVRRGDAGPGVDAHVQFPRVFQGLDGSEELRQIVRPGHGQVREAGDAIGRTQVQQFPEILGIEFRGIFDGEEVGVGGGALPQEARQFPGSVPGCPEGGLVRVGGQIFLQPAFTDGGAVDPAGVAVGGLEIDRRIREKAVQLFFRGLWRFGTEVIQGPAHACDPTQFRVLLRKAHRALHAFRLGLHAVQVHLRRAEGVGGTLQVSMTVAEAGHDEPVAVIPHLRHGAAILQGALVGAHEFDTVATDGHASGKGFVADGVKDRGAEQY